MVDQLSKMKELEKLSERELLLELQKIGSS
jgi:hypothetical protein